MILPFAMLLFLVSACSCCVLAPDRACTTLRCLLRSSVPLLAYISCRNLWSVDFFHVHVYVPPVRSARFDLFIDDPSPPFFIFPCKFFLSLFFLASFCLCNSAKVGLKSRRVLLEYFFLSFFFFCSFPLCFCRFVLRSCTCRGRACRLFSLLLFIGWCASSPVSRTNVTPDDVLVLACFSLTIHQLSFLFFASLHLKSWSKSRNNVFPAWTTRSVLLALLLFQVKHGSLVSFGEIIFVWLVLLPLVGVLFLSVCRAAPKLYMYYICVTVFALCHDSW